MTQDSLELKLSDMIPIRGLLDYLDRTYDKARVDTLKQDAILYPYHFLVAIGAVQGIEYLKTFFQ